MLRKHSQERTGPESLGRGTQRRGSVLVVGLVIAVMLTLTMAAAISTTQARGKAARWQLDQTRALALAEGIAESAKRLVLEQISRFEAPRLSGTVAIDGKDYPYTFSAVAKSFERTGVDGFRHTIQRYRLSTSVRVGDGAARVVRFVDLTRAPVFQYMLFHVGDLELFPGRRMSVDGRVHAGGDLRLDSGESLIVNTESFRATGSIHRTDRYGGSEWRGAVEIKVAGKAAFRNMKRSDDARRRDWPSFALARWQGTVQDGAHRVARVATPGISSLKAFLPDGTKGYDHQRADLIVIDWIAYDRNGAVRTLPASTITQRTMYDARERRHITLTEIDLALLGNAGAFPRNGLLYAYRTDASPSAPGGIRLRNGAELRRSVTIASEDPVFIQGDFNTVSKKPAAVLADAVNLLSNAWDDTKTSTHLTAATETEYNLAFATGNVPTSRRGYSGGFAGLPRFHENWTGVTARIRGSFVCLFESEVATGPWRLDNVYLPPLRDWRFDRALTEPAGLPPFAPVGAHFRDILWDDGIPLPFALR